MGLLCALCASAGPIRVTGTVNYGAAYHGSGRGVYTTSTARFHSVGNSGLAQAPVATMHSTSRDMAMATTVQTGQPMTGIHTSASAIGGGRTTAEIYTRNGHIKRDVNPGHGEPNPDCGHCVDEDGDDICDICGCNLLDGCTCNPCTCDAPIGDGAEVWAFMTALAGAYALYKQKIKKVE